MVRKVFILLIVIIIHTSTFGQAPSKFNYQAVIRNNSGELITNQSIKLRVSIIDGSSTIYTEEHSITTNAHGIVNIKIGEGDSPTSDFCLIDWGAGTKSLKIEIDETGGSSFSNLGTVQLLSVPYALYANSANQLGSQNIYSPDSDTLFVVKDHDENVVFAVFPDGAAVYVNETAKGKIGGFAVSGRTPSKNIEEEYLVVTPDSTRVYINEVTETKGKIGGFAVSGRTPSKGIMSSLMNLTKENYFIGHEAGVNTDVGLYNTFLGYYAGFTNYNGYNNIFIGDSAGFYNESGGSNIFIGNKTGKQNTSGYRNIFIGTESGFGNLSGRYNVFVGDKAGHSNTTGGGNVIIGATSGELNTTGYYNVFLGNWSGRSNTSGHENIFVGNRSGWYNTEGYKNIFIGSYSGYKNEIGSNNIFFGDSSGCSNTSADNNIFIGNKSGFANTEGSRNLFLGYQSGFTNKTGDNNVFIGNNAGFSNISGFKNVFIGDSAGYFNNEGRYNIFIGDRVGFANTSGNANVIIGPTAGENNTTGRANTFIGDWCGNKNETGDYNVFLGDQTGWNNISGSRNVYLGNRAGFNNTEGWNNVFIGNYAGFSEEESGKLYIDIADTDSTNTLVWGNFYSNIIRLNGQVGIGTHPTSALDINGDLKISGSIINSKPIQVDGIKFLNSFGPDSDFIAEGNYMTFGHPGISEDFIGYKNNTFYFLDSPDGGDVINPDVYFGGKIDVIDSLNVYGIVRFRQVETGAFANDLSITSNGTLTTQTSDRRLKKNIKPISEGLNKVLQLNGYTFNWNSENDSKTDAGLIAQEVLEIFPEAVFINPYDGYYGINYSRFPALFVEALKQQQTIIESQQQQIDELKLVIEEFRKQLEEIKD